jgi:hypothetical protein
MVPSFESWSALPEFAVPDSGVLETTILKAGVLIVKLRELGPVSAKHCLSVGDGVHGLLGTVTIECASGARLMRLPQVICGWAAEWCAAAYQGVKPFPARVRFRAIGRGIGVTFVDLAPKVMTPAKSLIVYIDESGNTGDAAIVGNLEGVQPSFALVGLGEVDGRNELDRVMGDIRKRHGIQASEIKSRSMNRHPELVCDLVEALGALGLPLFVELTDKAFFVATNIVSYVLAGPWLPLSSPGSRAVANALADVVTENIGSNAIIAYCDFARTPSPLTLEHFKSTFRRELAKAQERVSGGDLAEMLALIAEVFDESVEVCEDQTGDTRPGYTRLLPPPDLSRSGKLIAMLPHIPAFTNLYARVNRFTSDSVTVHALHDEQAHFGALLQGYATSLGSNVHAMELTEMLPPELAQWKFAPGKCSLGFADSRRSAGIQAADILARFFARRLNAIINGSVNNDDPALSTLWKLQNPARGLGINIVSTSRRFGIFWGKAASEGPFGPAAKFGFSGT